MKAMLGLVAVVAIIATTGAYVPEYGTSDVYVYSPADPEAETSTAQILNPETGMKFQVSDTLAEEGVLLVPDPSSDLTGIAKDDCGKSLGIKVTNIGQTFCNISFLMMSVESYEQMNSEEEVPKDGVHVEIPQLMVYFYDTGNPFVLEIPVFKVPSNRASDDKVKLQKWATGENVGIDSPFDNDMLSNISEKREWKGDFQWLSDLLSFGIMKSEETYQTTVENTVTAVVAYTARPIVLSAGTIDKFIQVVNKYKKNSE